MNPILVTGGAGYVGSVCCAQLLSRGFSVEVVDDLSAGHADAVPQPAVVHRLDVGDLNPPESLLAYKNLDVELHFAATPLTSQPVTNPGPSLAATAATGAARLP